MAPIELPARKNILFDLDGTLLPMDMDQYIRYYFSGLSRSMPFIPADSIHKVLWEGISAMMKNDGSRTNRAVFADIFTARTGVDYYENEKEFLKFYRGDYNDCIAACTPTPLAAQLIDTLQKKGYRVIIATSPLYPEVATLSRLSWAGLRDFSFPLVTTFHDFCTAKPNPQYYTEVCEKLSILPEECIMVGNDAEEDGAALEAGMDVIMVTDCLINKRGLSLDAFHQASLEDVLAWAQSLPALS